MVKRKIVAIAKRGLTNRGNPRWYWVVLECGHVLLKHYSPSMSVDEFLLIQGLKPKKRCKDCKNNKSVNLEMLREFTPWIVWNEQNFNRFKKTTEEKQ